MAIEKATEDLQKQNESGLDRRLLLPSVEAKEEAQKESKETGGLFRSINNLTVSIERTNEVIIDQLVDLNETMLRIEAKEPGAGGAENILQTVTRLPGRAVRKVGSAVGGIGRAVMDYNPISLALGAGRSALRGIGSGLMAGPRAIGNLVGNMFQSKNQKALFDITKRNLDNTTAIKESNAAALKELQWISRALANEFKLRRSGRLDALEDRRDKRKTAGGAAAAAAGGNKVKMTKGPKSVNPKVGDAEGSWSSWMRNAGFAIGGWLAGKGSLGAILTGAAATAASAVTGTVKTVATKAGPLGVALSAGFGLLDTEYKKAGYTGIDRAGLGFIENSADVLDGIANITGMGKDVDISKSFKDFAISQQGKNMFQWTPFGHYAGRVKNPDVTKKIYTSEAQARKAAEKYGIYNYTIKEIEGKGHERKKDGSIGKRMVYKIISNSDYGQTPASMNKKQTATMMSMEPIANANQGAIVSNMIGGRDKMLEINQPGNMFSTQGSIFEASQKLIKEKDVPTIILRISPNSNVEELFRLQLENFKRNNNMGGSPHIIAPSDNRDMSSNTTNQTVLSQIMGSTADITNKVVPV